jgi:hypothetical protein
VGTKTDILALAGETSLSYITAADRLDRDILRQCGLILFSGLKKNKDYENRLKKIANRHLNFEYIGYEHFTRILSVANENYKCIKKNPSTGINILCKMVSDCNIFFSENKLLIYGFDCFKSGHYFNNEKRNYCEFHDLEIEKQIIEYLKKFKNIKFFN